MRILLTGANGQVGHEIIKASQQYPIELISCDKQTLDIAEEKAVANCFEKHQPQLVINAAAYTVVDKAESERESAFAVNALGPEYLAKNCAKLNIPLIHFSTDYVFDGQKTGPYLETDPVSPLGVYGESKLQGERAIQNYLDKYLIFRISWVFGQHGHNFVKTMLRLMQEKQELHIVADQIGCPTYAGHVAKIIFEIIVNKFNLLANHWGTYHYCDIPALTWYEFAKVIHAEASKYITLRTERIIPITTAEYPTPAKRPKNSVLDCSKFIQLFNINLSEWQQGLREMLSDIQLLSV